MVELMNRTMCKHLSWVVRITNENGIIIFTCIGWLTRLIQALRTVQSGPELRVSFNTWRIYDKAYFKPQIHHGVTRDVSQDMFKTPPKYALGYCVAQDLKISRGIAQVFRRRFGETDILEHQVRRCIWSITANICSVWPQRNYLTRCLSIELSRITGSTQHHQAQHTKTRVWDLKIGMEDRE